MTLNKPPDLVRRAAERLGTVQRGVGSGHSLPAAGSIPPGIIAAPESHSLLAGGRSVVVSPTALAANGIFMPSSADGFVLTIEEFRSIKRQVIANISRTDRPGTMNRAVLITSARPGDGKTFTAINLAMAVAFERDRKVILIDADARRHSVTNYMGIKAEAGWIDMLAPGGPKLSEVLLATNVPNLSILPSGTYVSDLPELLASRRMTEFVAELDSASSDAILIFDSVPCLVSNEPSILADRVGQVVFVVAANETGQDEVQTSLGYLTQCPTVSLVLNKGVSFMSEQFARYGYYYSEKQS